MLTRSFLAHLSRRLTRWAYSIPMVRRPSVVVRGRPHIQTWISLKPVGQSWSNFMCSIIAVGETLHKILGQIGLKLWFPWQQKAPLTYNRENDVSTFFSVVCSMFPLAFVAWWLQGHWWGFISRNYVVWPTFFLMNVFIALKGSHFWFFIWLHCSWCCAVRRP